MLLPGSVRLRTVMRKVLVVLLLGSSVVAARAGVLPKLTGGHQTDRAQHDEPSAEQSDASDMQHLIEALSRSFMDLRQQQSDSWYSRYNALANQNANNSAVVIEILEISRIAYPIIWNTVISSSSLDAIKDLRNGKYVTFDPSGVERAQHPLQVVHTELVDTENFVVQVTLKLKEEVNVGLRLMYETVEGQDFDWDEDDIFVGVHLRWHFDYGNSREVAINDKYDGVWGPNESISGEDKWPNLVVQEKFQMTIMKEGKWLYLLMTTGMDRFYQIPKPFNTYIFCPQPREGNKVEQDPRKLMVVVDEQHVGTGEVEVHTLMWYPTTIRGPDVKPF